MNKDMVGAWENHKGAFRNPGPAAAPLLFLSSKAPRVSSQNQEKDSCVELGSFEEKKQPDQGHATGMELGE